MKFIEDIVSAVTEEECAKICELAKGKVVLELGSHLGRSTVALASVAQRVHAVDWHLGDGHTGRNDTAPAFIENLTKHQVRNNVVIHIGKFDDVLPLFKEHSFDFCFIDAFHTKEAVMHDALSVIHLLKPTSAIAFHDYGRPAFGVTPAVEEFAALIRSVVSVVGNVAVVTLP